MSGNVNVVEMFANPREIYGKELAKMGGEHEDIVVLTADVTATNKLADFRAAYPQRFFNVGIAEANLMGIGAGLAVDGNIPFVSTFAAFASMRAHEQVRTDIAYPNLPVKIIATMSGLSGGVAGPTHQGMEDLGTMRMMPNMTVLAPGDPLQMAQFMRLAYEIPGPVYIRLGRGDDPVIYEDGQEVVIGKAITIQEGSDLTIIACGTVVSEAVAAGERLAAAGISVRVLDMHTIKPIDVDAILDAAETTGRIITVEDHSVIGGLGSSVAEVIATAGVACSLRRLGVPDVFGLVGPPTELFHHYGFDADGIELAAIALVGR
jgi:transketolase